MTNETHPGETKGARPVGKINIGHVTASVWKRIGERGAFHVVTFERRYRNADGAWKTSHAYGLADLAELRTAAEIAHQKLIELHAQQPPQPS